MKALNCKCGKQFLSWKKAAKFCSNICKYKYRMRPHGLFYRLKVKNRGWFKKGIIPISSYEKKRTFNFT